MEAILFIELTEELKFSRGNKEHAARVIASTFNVPFKDKLNETISNALDCAVENSKKAQNFTYNKIASRLFNYAKDMGIKVNPEKLKELQND